MEHRLGGILLAAVLLAPIGACAAVAEEEAEDLDSVRRTDTDRPSLTKITKDDYLTVEGRYKTSALKLESYKVTEILRADRAEEYNQALERRAAGRPRVAARFFYEALERMKGKPWAAEYCNYGVAEALYDEGLFTGYKGATHSYLPPSHYYGEVMKANPKSRFLLDAATKRIICFIEEGKLGEADGALVEAEKALKQYRDDTAKTNDPNYRPAAERAEAQVKLARAKELEKKADATKPPDYGPALSACSAAETASSRRFPAVYSDAVEMELRMLVKGRDFAGAKARAEEEIARYRREPDPDLLVTLPVAYTVVGRACYAQASELEAGNRTPEALREFSESRWNYLRVLVEFFDKEEYVAEAGYYAGLCYDKLKGVEEGSGDKAIRCWLNVKRSFADSDFAARADQELKRVGYKEPPPPADKAGAKPGEKAGATPGEKAGEPKDATPPPPAPPPPPKKGEKK